MRSYQNPRDFSDAWLKAIKKALAHPNFKVTGPPKDYDCYDDLTAKQRANIIEAQTLIRNKHNGTNNT